jgi:hypothetical protein
MQKIVAQTNGDTTEGWLATWNTGHVDRGHVINTFEAAGYGKCIGSQDALLALKDAVRLTVDNLGLKERGSPIDVSNLDKSSVGCCAVREIRGARQNQYPLVFSCALMDLGGGIQRVQLIDVNPEQAPSVDANRAGTELMLNAAFHHFQQLMQPTHLTSSLAKMLKQLYAVRIKEGVYFLPGKFTEVFDSVVSSLESHPSCEASFTTLVWSLVPDSRAFRAVINAARDEISGRLNDLNKELGEMQTNGIKMRTDGLQTRLRQCMEMREFANFYGESVGNLGEDIEQLIAATEAGIANYGMLALTSV